MSFVSEVSLDMRAAMSEADIEEAIVVLKFCSIIGGIGLF